MSIKTPIHIFVPKLTFCIFFGTEKQFKITAVHLLCLNQLSQNVSKKIKIKTHLLACYARLWLSKSNSKSTKVWVLITKMHLLVTWSEKFYIQRVVHKKHFRPVMSEPAVTKCLQEFQKPLLKLENNINKKLMNFLKSFIRE